MTKEQATGIFNNKPQTVISLSIKNPAGCWVISGDLRIYVGKKPNFWFKFWHKALLGWKFEEQNDE